MHWLGYTKRKLKYSSLQTILKNLKSACIPSASLPASQSAIRSTCARCRAPEISHHKGTVMAADLRKCCSEDDLPTALWRFLSFFLIPCSLFL